MRVVTRGYGLDASIGFVVLRGYGDLAQTETTPTPTPTFRTISASGRDGPVIVGAEDRNIIVSASGRTIIVRGN